MAAMVVGAIGNGRRWKLWIGEDEVEDNAVEGEVREGASKATCHISILLIEVGEGMREESPAALK